MIDTQDISQMIALMTAWLMTNVSVFLAVVIMLLQIYVLALKIKKMKKEERLSTPIE